MFASCWSSVHVRLDFPLKAMQIYTFSVESPNEIGYFFDLSQKKVQRTKYNVDKDNGQRKKDNVDKYKGQSTKDNVDKC